MLDERLEDKNREMMFNYLASCSFLNFALL
jgi:hypothetical protein